MSERGYVVENIQPNSLVAAETTLRAYQMSVGGQEKKAYSIRLNGVYYLGEQAPENQGSASSSGRKREGNILYSPLLRPFL